LLEIAIKGWTQKALDLDDDSFQATLGGQDSFRG
jgi:hypothetical protein